MLFRFLIYFVKHTKSVEGFYGFLLSFDIDNVCVLYTSIVLILFHYILHYLIKKKTL